MPDTSLQDTRQKWSSNGTMQPNALSRPWYAIAGTVVGNVKAVHHERFTPFLYSVLEDDGEGLFLVSPHSGEFLLSRALDYEAQRHYVLTVTVQSGDLDVSSVRVYFNVVDVNDNPPVFREAIYSVSLPEDTTVGTCFLALNVSDKDDGINGETDVEVTTGDKQGTFLVNPDGVLCLNSELDRERRSTYNLTIQARDRAQPPTTCHTSTALVHVQVDDVNDNAPHFVSGKSVNIPEDTPPHTVVMVIQAVDSDIGSNGDVFYTLVDSAGGVFSISSTSGSLYLQESLDREQVDTLAITLAATDKGSPQLTTFLNLTVHVEDTNDHDPAFTQSSYFLTVGEDASWGTNLLQVKAQDPDQGSNGEVRYQLNQGGPFVVDSFRGVVSVMDRLDRESESSYMLFVIAMDQGVPPRSARAVVNVTLLDVNDFTPLFAPATLTLHVLENGGDPSQLIHQIQAVDEDLEENSLPPLTGTATVHVIVDDMNDNKPVFSDVFTTIVPEDAPLGTVFAMITASDWDDGVYGLIRYSVDEENRFFSIDESSGELFTTGVLDREAVAFYRLTVIARDTHPTHPLSSSTLVTVLIGDVNDHWPQFLYSPYVANMPADSAPVQAVDGDSGINAQLQFSLYGINADQFTIHPLSGAVFTSNSLTATEDITVNVHVEDGGEHPKFDTTTITIRLRNTSDFPVVNVDADRLFLSEDEPAGTVITVASAESSRRGPVSLYLISGNLDNAFQLHPSNGELTLKNPLDYETTKDYVLLVEGRDSGSPPFSSYAEIHINISDCNDNVPEFTQREYRCEVFENAPPTWLCDVLAIDVDSGSYGSVLYSIIDGNTDGAFTIDSENGILSTTVSLDRESVPEYNLTIESVDQDNILYKDIAFVLIVVLDTNDHAPRFSQIFFTTISEDAPIGYTAMQIISTDEDVGPNAVITYSIINQSDDIPFQIDVTSGCIKVEQYLDRETQDHYVLQVNANDSAWSISTDVSIDITDINDNRPVFSQSLYSVTLAETKDWDVFVVQVVATDEDTAPNSYILYFIEPASEEFWVNATTGGIYTKQPMSLQHSANIFIFTVLADDCGGVPPHSNTTVVVTFVPYNHFPPVFLPLTPLLVIPFDVVVGTELVQLSTMDLDMYPSNMSVKFSSAGGNASEFFVVQSDSGMTEIHFEITGKNLFAPQFLESHDTFSVPENLPVGSVIGKVHAIDKDDGVNGIVTYSIISGPKDVPFSIGQHSGLITLVQGVDYEKKTMYYLHISARDGGWRPENGTISITVNITDVNDNPPVFTASEYLASVPENSAVGTLVFQMEARDADSGTNAYITYSLVAGNTDKFAVNPKKGTITTLDMFDFEMEQSFDLTVKASNTGGRHLFSLAHVTILVSGINEFIPVFLRNELNFTVSDSVPVGTTVGRVTATDSDQGFDGKVFYLLFGQSKKTGFDADEQTGEIYTTQDLRKLGFNHAGLRILAKNYGVITGVDIDEAFIQINIIDTNDPPEFTFTVSTAEVSEDTIVGTSIMTVSALDQDAILEWNTFSYSIISGNANSSFSVDPFSGVITVHSPLDRELWPVYNLTIAAIDYGSPPATGTANVVLDIGDINDNAPRVAFTEASVRENQPHGTIVATLNTSDADLAPNQGPFTYWLAQPSLDNSFSLTSDGVLFTTRPVDRELTPEFYVVVAVRDSGTPPLSSTTTLQVKILDENDNPSVPRNVYIEVKYYGSSFSGGLIGHVQPEDQDETSVYNCSIRNGHLNMFSIPFSTCELWSSPYKGEATYNITIEASDELHPPVNNSVYVNYKGFTNASMISSILFYVSSSSVEEFLSHKYLKFVKALDSLFNLQASKTHVFGMKLVGNEILLLAAVKSYNGQYLSAEVASGISALHRKLLESQSNVTILRITSDPCLFNPCQNGGTCNKDIHISQDVALLESSALAFVSPQMEIFNCSCLAGFTGPLCESDMYECDGTSCDNEGTSSHVGECLKVNCQNGGSCFNRPEGFHCYCKDGYEGKLCERSVDNCASSPCSEGTCINSVTGYSCNCPFGVSGTRCQEHSLGFEELSFMEFPPLDPHNNIILLELASVQQDSLLLVNPGSPLSVEFLALELLGGRARFSYNLGSGLVRLETKKQVADGHFHSITARRIGNIGSLEVDSCSDIEANGFCFSQNEGISSQRTLDGASNMSLGGVRSIESILQIPTHIQSHDFVGCLRNVKVNGIPLVPSKALATYNILQSCPRDAVSPCDSSPCKNGGACQDMWSHYLCYCRNSYTGASCATVVSEEHVLRLNGNGYIAYGIRESYRRNVQLRDLLNTHSTKEKIRRVFSEIEVKIKTINNDGVLVFVLGRIRHTVLRIVDGQLQYISIDSRSGHLSEVTVNPPVADGIWHVLHLYREGHNTIITIDEQLSMNTTNGTLDLTPVNVEKMVLGAVPPGTARELQPGFSGCVAYFRVTGYILPVGGTSEMVEAWPSSTLTQPTCVSQASCVPSHCTDTNSASMRPCLSVSCETGRDCGELVRSNMSCICLHNASAVECDVCPSLLQSRHGCFSELQQSKPLWILAVVVPVTCLLLLLCLFITLRRQKASSGCQESCHGDSPLRREQGAENQAFSHSDNTLVKDVSGPPDVIGADSQRLGVGCYSEACLQSLQSGVLEYYEIDSNYSHSDMASLRLSWHGHTHNTHCDRTEPRWTGFCQPVLSGPLPSQESRDKPLDMWQKSQLNLNLYVPQNTRQDVDGDGLLNLLDCESGEVEKLHFFERFPEFMSPPLGLSVEEVRRLNSPLEEMKPNKSGQPKDIHAPGTSARVTDSLSDTVTHGSFTVSEFESETEFLPSSSKGIVCEWTYSSREPDIFPVHDTFQSNALSRTEAVCGGVQQWETLLNMSLQFETYAHVFEDIAGLPFELKHDCNMQSDQEEII
ncbi:protocadherin Fat 4 [Osmerus eperlanus]|uniref:protocadherin Fat 4 n=1 Tax=Osmerus eperlanus TaxID=29151 RepID=UPI002E0D57F4